MTIRSVPVGDLFDTYVTPGQYDMTVFSWIGTAYPVSGAQSIYTNPVKKADGSLDIQQNFARVGSPEIDELFKKATAELDEDKPPRPRTSSTASSGRWCRTSRCTSGPTCGA